MHDSAGYMLHTVLNFNEPITYNIVVENRTDY